MTMFCNLAFAVLAACAGTMPAAGLSSNPDLAPQWEVADSWQVFVEAYTVDWSVNEPTPERESKKNIPVTFARYSMTIRIAGTALIESNRCWRIDFLPGEDAPDIIKTYKFHIWVSQKDSRLVRIDQNGTGIDHPGLLTFDSQAIIEQMVPGFPIQIISPFNESLTVVDKHRATRRLHLKRESTGGYQVLEVKYDMEYRRGNIKNPITVRQTWAPGAKWWSTYECYTHGHIYTRAWLESASPPPITPFTPPVEPKEK